MKNNIILLLCCLGSLSLLGQNQGPINLSIGSIKSALKEQALDLTLSYAQSLDTIFEKQDYLFDWDKGLFMVTPDILIETGDKDAFSSIALKVVGLTMIFDTTNIDGFVTPDTEKLFHTFPSSIGVETNNDFSIINGIIEIGYSPWYQNVHRPNSNWLNKTKFGFFIQSGYKFDGDTTAIKQIGGEIDESMEAVNSAILRAKGNFGINTNSIFTLGPMGLGIVGHSDIWYDFLNGEIYYSLEGKVRFYLTYNEDKYFDLKYEKGSGAPNFNQGEQYGISLTITF